MKKLKTILNKIHIRPIYLIMALLLMLFLFWFVQNQDWVLRSWLPNLGKDVYNFFYNNLFICLINKQYQAFFVRLVIGIVMIFVVVLIILSFQRDLALAWFRSANKPFNTYQYGHLKWITYYQKRKYLNRCYFDNINTQGTPVETAKEKILYLFGFPIPLSIKPVFVRKDNITYDNLKADNQVLKVIEEKEKQKKDAKPYFTTIHKNERKWFGIEKGTFIYLYDFLKTPGNTLELAPSQAGKTTQFVLVLIDILSRINDYKKKPSMILSDPKGEVFSLMAETLKARGYKILSVNFKGEMFTHTHCFNPLRKVYEKYEENFNKIKPHLNMDLITGSGNPIKEYYRQLELLPENAKASYSFDPAKKLLEGIATTFIPTDVGNDPFWPQNAQGVMNSVLYYMLEICVLANEPDKYSIFALITYLQSSDAFLPVEQNYIDPETNQEKQETISEYEIILKSLPQYHYSVIKMPKGVKPEQQATFKNDVISKLNLFAGSAKKITSFNNIDIDEFLEGDQPIALFLITPDMEKTFNPIVNTIIEQFYLFAATKADDNKSKKLNRNIEFILDEFANIPKIKDIDTKVSVCLARGIRFNMIVQNEEQLDEVYGENTKHTIKSNALHQIFLGGNDIKACKDFSAGIGNTTKLIENDQIGSGNMLDWKEESVPLITPEELAEIKLGTTVHKIKSCPPIKASSIPSFTYQGNYKKTSPEEFYGKLSDDQAPHIKADEKDLLFDRVLNPFNDQPLIQNPKAGEGPSGE